MINSIGDTISGKVTAGYEAVQSAFVRNFEQDLECGAAFYVIKDGDVVVDLVGGYTSRKRDALWDARTLVPVYSSTKAVAAIVIAHLADQDKLGYDQKVASLWADFAQNGKADITIGDILSHQSGLSGITNPQWTPEDWYDWDKTCAQLASQSPIWPLGQGSGYHPVTYGYLVGEIARRVDGRTLGTILREDICEPHGIDFYIGTPVSEHDRCADLLKPRQLADLGEINPATRAAFMEKWSSPSNQPTQRWRQFEVPSTNGHGNAKSLAQLISVFIDGRIGGDVYLAEDMLLKAKAPRVSGQNLVLPFDLTIAAGVMHNAPNMFYGPVNDTVGHSGWGGSCVFADAQNGLAVAYVMNRQSHHLLGDPRPLALIKALYQSL